jgi:hypothetical protein
MNTLSRLASTARRHLPGQRPLMLWALVLAAATLSAFVYTVQQSLERAQAGRAVQHGQATPQRGEVDEFVLSNASLATAR